MKMRRTLLALLLLLAACGGTPAAPASPTASTGAESDATQPTAAASAGGEEITLNLWAFAGEDDVLPKLKETFEAQNPNVTIEITDIPEDQYVTKIDTALAANEPPDIAYIYERRWLKAGKFLPIDDMIASNGLKLEDFNQGALATNCQYEGKMYCLGSYTGSVLLYYNKDLFDAAGATYPSSTQPMTIDEYAALADRLTKNRDDIATKVWGGAADVPFWWMDWRTNFSEDGRKADGFANDEATVHTYEVLADMVKRGNAPSSTEMQTLGEANLLAQGRQAMAITDNFVAISDLEAQNIRYGAAPVPVEKKGDAPFVPTWTDGFGTFSQSKHAAEAIKFLHLLATEGNNVRLGLGALPLNMKLADEQGWARKNDGRKETLEATMLARGTIFVPGFWDVTAPLGDALTQIVEGQKTAKEALDEAAPAMQDSLDKAWETWEQIR
jgi:multiple sugar transport system substrate-binding protein